MGTFVKLKTMIVRFEGENENARVSFKRFGIFGKLTGCVFFYCEMKIALAEIPAN